MLKYKIFSLQIISFNINPEFVNDKKIDNYLFSFA